VDSLTKTTATVGRARRAPLEDLVQLSAVEPHVAAFGTVIDLDAARSDMKNVALESLEKLYEVQGREDERESAGADRALTEPARFGYL
jgi:hypothetical protein